MSISRVQIATANIGVQLKKKFSFGVGCLHFGVPVATRQVGASDCFDSYKELLKQHLSKFSNIKRIKIDGFDSFSLAVYSPSSDDKGDKFNLNDASGIFPHPISSSVKFQIEIPKRQHSEIFSGFETPLNAENYEVNIAYEYSLPIVMVRALDGDLVSPSDAIILVREFFRHNQKDDDAICLQCLGPSPFHAQLHVVEDSNVPEFEWNIEFQEGYDDITLYYNKDILEHTPGFVEMIPYFLARELSPFYALEQIDNRLSQKEYSLRLAIDQLIKSKKAKLHSRVPSVFSSRRISVLTIDALQLKAEIGSIGDMFRKALDEKERTLDENPFRMYMEKQFNDIESRKPDDQLELLSALKEHTKDIKENYLLTLAAFIGFIGAIIGSYISKSG